MPEVEQAILYGFNAVGRRDFLTDLDLVVMSSGRDFVIRAAELYPKVATGTEVDLSVCAPRELEHLHGHTPSCQRGTTIRKDSL